MPIHFKSNIYMVASIFLLLTKSYLNNLGRGSTSSDPANVYFQGRQFCYCLNLMASAFLKFASLYSCSSGVIH